MGVCCAAADESVGGRVDGIPRTANGRPSNIMRSGIAMKPKLYYFDSYGRAEVIRMLLHLTKTDFEDIRLSQEEFAQMKEEGFFPNGQVPVWIDEKGMVFNHTSAILIMIAKKHDLYSSDYNKSYIDDWALDTMNDLVKPAFYLKLLQPECEEEEIEAATKMFRDWNKVVNRKFAELETPYFGGEKPSLADIVLLQLYSNVALNSNLQCNDMQESLEQAYIVSSGESFKAWVQRMEGESMFEEYLAQRPVAHF